MGRSLHLGTYAGIPVKVHWTFGLMLMIIFYIGVQNQLNPVELGFFFLLVLTLFLCVILHEYGHALTARFYKVNTRDIIISPIGGVARLEKLPNDPKEEFVIAIAGPLVNVFIALICMTILFFITSENMFTLNPDAVTVDNPIEFLKTVFYINVVLFLFNLIPAFPMDGGRVLRSLLSIKLGKVRSTKIASTIGKIIALFFIGIGLYISHYALAIIGGFIFYMASNENKQVELEERLKLTTIDTILNSNFTKIYLDEPMSKPIDISIRTKEHNFLIYNQYVNRPVGTMHALFIKDAITNQNQNAPVSKYVSTKLRLLTPDTSIYLARQILNQEGLSIAAIGHSLDHIIGVVDRDAIVHFMNLTE